MVSINYNSMTYVAATCLGSGDSTTTPTGRTMWQMIRVLAKIERSLSRNLFVPE
jgi:hypothetical protein